ncbi:hypothetical protein EHV15_34410 [Paenibacillus oralis]|uniref:DUF5983 domain-containing protein n=1 Tax=Paenibacillus oralis TaxID=2490856 RepID=A0A3P3TE28_9BACL|nr:hypothetical protein [Paenibacillus oralis]RRJ54693.1 hypothetical protein EHV15_34410 [Paenibacillus oralis]
MGKYWKIPVIHSMLEVSTAHLSKETLKWLGEHADSIEPSGFIVYAKSEYGYFIPIIDSDDSLSEDRSIPDDLRKVIEFAESQQCTWIMIERDGFVIDQLPLLE